MSASGVKAQHVVKVMQLFNLKGPETLQSATQKLAGTMVLLKLICTLESPNLGADAVSAHLQVALEFGGGRLIGVFHVFHQPTVSNSANAVGADEQGRPCVLMGQLRVPVICQNTKKHNMALICVPA